MIIIGITGALCAGKKTAAEYLQICYGFRVLNLEAEDWEKKAGFVSMD
jgi:dephospho-CoA kinase